MTKGRLLLCAFAAAALLAPSDVVAQNCSWSVSAIAFGPVDTLSGGNDDTTGLSTISCTGTAGRTVRLCPNLGFGNGGLTTANRRMLSGANVLTYQLYSDTWGGTIWGSTLFAPNPPNPPALTMTLPSSPLSQSIFARVFGGQSAAPPGSYTSTYNPATHRRLYYQYCTGGPGTCPACGTFTSANAASFTITATVASNCLVTATTLNFGSQGFLSANVDATNAISVTCTPGTAWTTSLSAGSGAGATVVLRKMTGPGAVTINYTIYRDAARTQVWGNGTSGTFTVAGTGSGSAQVQTGYGRVPPQTTPAPATYSDTIVVTVTY
ncbi:MAG: spore coat protein U domain-containing protein [Methyloceanibacter sp.]|jgi:spore coat protein U-like protein